MKNFILLTAMVAMCHCTFAQIPAISSFTPASGPIGAQVTISGSNFSTTAADNHVYFGAVKAVVQSASTTSLTVTVPVGATFQPPSVAVNNLIAYADRPFIVTYAGGGMDFTATSFASPIDLAGDHNITSADLDGDHRIDLICGYASNKITVHRNTTAGGPVSFAPIDIGSFYLPRSTTACDLNGDGLLDLVAVGTTQDILHVLKNTSTSGSISFNSPITLSTGVAPRRVAIRDLDNDGKADIVCTRESIDAIAIFRNTSVGGNITFAAKADFPNIGANCEGIAIGDLNKDGKPDIVGGHYGGRLFVYENTSTPGMISFNVRPELYVTGSLPSTVAIADIDGDGWADMMASNSYGNSVTIYRNKGTNPLAFDMRVDLPISSGSGEMALNDLNADGKPDIVTVSRFDGSTHYITVVKNTSTPGNISFEASIAYASNTGTSSVTLADLDNDGLTDIATGDFNSASLSIFKNQLNINTSLPQCPALLTPANNATSINYGTPQLITWKKDINATGYRLLITEQGGAYTDVTTTDTFYLFTPSPGINYTWTVTPSNMANPLLTCAGFGFSTCATAANMNTITATAGTSICSTDSVQITTTATSNIQWFFNNQPIAGATGTSIQAKKGGAYTARILNGSCYSNPTNTVMVTTLPTPVKPLLSQINDTTFCDGGSVNFVSSLNSNNQWFKNNTIINNATGISYNATTTGDYFVRVMNTSSGCYNFSDTVSVSVLPTPATPTISVTGNPTFCMGDSLLMHANSAIGIKWYKDHVAIPGATSQDYYAKGAGAYTVTTTQSGCTSPESSSLSPTVFALPAKPIITSGGTSLSTAAGLVSYVWYRDNVIIPGATTNQYATTQNGVYKVTVGDINGCKNTSDNFNYITTGFNDVYFQGYTIQLYPNPVINELYVQVNQTLSGNGTVSMVITDGTGKHIQSQTLRQGSNTIYFKHLAPGVYMVLLKNGRSEKTIKILKVP